MAFIFSLLLVFSAHALEVIKPQYHHKIELKIVQAGPDSFETYSLMNHNGREMTLVCAHNRVYDDNAKAFLEYRNYYNEIVANFQIDNDQACKELARMIETSSAGISPEKPLLITLDTKSLGVQKIQYPDIDPFMDEGSYKDLLPKSPIPVKDFAKNIEIKKTVRPQMH